jgi:hypothetical protein
MLLYLRLATIEGLSVMKIRKLIVLTLVFSCLVVPCGRPQDLPSPVGSGSADAMETIVFIRHGEKPPGDYGQMTCQGLNRALALPDVLLRKYGTPNFIFAPNPAQKVVINGVEYPYIRALVAIEPTAIRVGLPIELKFGYRDIEPLQEELLSARYSRSLIFVAWEHFKLEELVKNILGKHGVDSAIVPAWNDDDYESIYVLKIRSGREKKVITFQHDFEGLNGLPTECPQLATVQKSAR